MYKPILILVSLSLLLFSCRNNQHPIDVDASKIDTVKVYQLGIEQKSLVNTIVDKEKIKNITFVIKHSDEELIKFRGNYSLHWANDKEDTSSVIVFGRFIKYKGHSYRASEDIEKLIVK